jgi:DNA-binding NarL/FixJ family response regulator
MEPHRASLIILVAEDETLVGMALEDVLTKAGYTVEGVFGTSSTALQWLERRRPDAAVLDCNLRDGPCVELVRELKARGVSILLYSAFTTVPDEFRDLPRLLKPGAFSDVIYALDKLLLVGESASSTSAAVDLTDSAVPASSEPRR